MKQRFGRAAVIGGLLLGGCGVAWGDAVSGRGAEMGYGAATAGGGVSAGLVAASEGGRSSGAAGQKEIFPTPDPVPAEELKEGVQVTELGCMRVALLFARGSEDVEKLVQQRLSDLDFRLFGSRVVDGGRMEASGFKALGKEREADLVFLVEVRSKEKNRFGDFVLHGAEGTVQIYSPISDELLITHTSRADGQRHTDAATAERSAREKAADMALGEAVTKCLEKAHKVIVHEALVKGVRDETHLLEVMAYLAKPEEVYHVRKLSFDPKEKLAKIEVIGAPRSVTFWRAHFEKIPGLDPEAKPITVRYVLHSELRKKRPEWFGED